MLDKGLDMWVVGICCVCVLAILYCIYSIVKVKFINHKDAEYDISPMILRNNKQHRDIIRKIKYTRILLDELVRNTKHHYT